MLPTAGERFAKIRDVGHVLRGFPHDEARFQELQIVCNRYWQRESRIMIPAPGRSICKRRVRRSWNWRRRRRRRTSKLQAHLRAASNGDKRHSFRVGRAASQNTNGTATDTLLGHEGCEYVPHTPHEYEHNYCRYVYVGIRRFLCSVCCTSMHGRTDTLPKLGQVKKRWRKYSSTDGYTLENMGKRSFRLKNVGHVFLRTSALSKT